MKKDAQWKELLDKLRESRIPSKAKRELRRKYARKYGNKRE